MTKEEAYRYIDNLKWLKGYDNTAIDGKTVGEILDEIKAMLEEQEAKTGHWISVNDGDTVTMDYDGVPERACFCSECKKYLTASDEYAVYGRYCPFCGAKMESR